MKTLKNIKSLIINSHELRADDTLYLSSNDILSIRFTDLVLISDPEYKVTGYVKFVFSPTEKTIKLKMLPDEAFLCARYPYPRGSKEITDTNNANIFEQLKCTQQVLHNTVLNSFYETQKSEKVLVQELYQLKQKRIEKQLEFHQKQTEYYMQQLTEIRKITAS